MDNTLLGAFATREGGASCCMLGMDTQLWLRDYRHGRWAPWQRLGAPAPGPSIEPVSQTAGTAATFGGPTVFSTFALGADGRM